MKVLVVRLDGAADATRERLGGKGAGLRALVAHGFPVPPGFVLTTDAFELFLRESGAGERIARVLASIGHDGGAELARAARALRRIVLSTPLPAALSRALSTATRALGARRVAVRSSAADEDGAERSWAGLLESELGVRADDVPRAVKRCWASSFGARALAYRVARARPLDEALACAVVVQAMVRPAKAGVAFSVDPVTADDAVVLVEAVHGLGEAAVGGAITPERHVVAKRTLAPLAVTPHRQRRALFARGDGETRWAPLSAAARARPVLAPAELRGVARAVVDAERAFGGPVDVEWARTARALYVLQCRPVTALAPPLRALDPSAVRWRFVHVRRRTPFFKSCFFAPMSELTRDLGIDYRMCPAGLILDAVVVAEDAWNKLAQQVSTRWTADPRWCLRTMAGAHDAHARALRRWSKLPRVRWADANGDGLARALERYVEDLAVFAPHVGWVAIGEDEMATRVRDGLRRRFGPEDAERAYAIAVDPLDEGSVQRERSSLLRVASLRARGRDAGRALDAHVARFAWMKNVGYFGEYYPREHYEREMERMSRAEPDAALARMAAEARSKRARFRALLRDVAGHPVLAASVRTANAAVAFRSYRTEIFYQSHVFVRELLAEIARRLGVTAQDVLFLFPDELSRLLRAGRGAPVDLIEARRSAFVWLSLPGARYMSLAGDAARACRIDLDGAPRADARADLRGQPAFSGKARGRATIVRTVDDLARVQRGDVLVAPATNIDFVPALERAAALVTEEGGILCHAAVVSREMRIPAVIGVKNATRLLAAGEQIEVDATCGVVRRLALSAEAR